MNQWKYVFRGEVASKKNSKRIVHAKGRSILLPSEAFMRWEKLAKKVILTSGKPYTPLKSASICIDIYHGDLLRRDTNNATQGVQDILSSMSVIEDDNWMVIGSPVVNHHIDIVDPRMEVSVTEIEPVDYKQIFKNLRKELKSKDKKNDRN